MPDQRMRLICPACGYEVDHLREMPWGDGNQRLAIAPFICAGCAEAMILDYSRCELTLIPPEGWELLKAKNPALVEQIVAVQERIRAFRQSPKG